MGLFDRLTTKHTFPDGTRASLLHRYALKLEMQERIAEIGFEAACLPGVDRLIDEKSIQVWKTTRGDEPMTSSERLRILEYVEDYCRTKGLSYEIVRTVQATGK